MRRFIAIMLSLALVFMLVPSTRMTTYAKSKTSTASKKKTKVKTSAAKSGSTSEAKKKVKVKRIKVSGPKKLAVGESGKLKAAVYPKKASNKKVKWKSSKPSVVTVTKSGRIKAKKKGKATITATAKDGSKKKKKYSIEVYTIDSSESSFVAHRGDVTDAPENTKAAFEDAGINGFWGCECDIWETSHDDNDDFDLVISHDDNYMRMTGVDELVVDLTVDDVKDFDIIEGKNAASARQKVCFLGDFLSICNDYDMVPVIDIKDKALTDDAVDKVVQEVEDYGLTKKAVYISTGVNVLRNVRNRTLEKLDHSPDTYYLSKVDSSYLYESMVSKAVENGFTGVGFDYTRVDKGVFSYIKKHNLKVTIWGFDKTSRLSLRNVLDKNKIDICTVDGKIYSK